MANTVKIRRGTGASAILAQGELGLDTDDIIVKIGDGTGNTQIFPPIPPFDYTYAEDLSEKSLAAGSPYTTIVSVSLGAGTWLVMGSSQVKSASSAGYIFLRLYNVTDGVGIGGEIKADVNAASVYNHAITILGSVVLTGTKTIAWQFAPDASYAAYVRNSSLFAIRIG